MELFQAISCFIYESKININMLYIKETSKDIKTVFLNELPVGFLQDNEFFFAHAWGFGNQRYYFDNEKDCMDFAKQKIKKIIEAL